VPNARPAVSVVVPVYDGERHVARCVESVLGQTCQDLELILLDDGSTDGTAVVLRECALRDPDRVRVYSHPNMGVARTRNRGIELARGEYLCFVDADDWLDPDFLEVCLAAMERDGADVVVGGYRRVVDGRVSFTFVPDPRAPYAKYGASTACGKLHRTSFLVEEGIVFPGLVFGEDMVFTVEENTRAGRVSVVPYAGYRYVVNRASTSQTYMRGGLVAREQELADLVTRLCEVDVPDGEAGVYDYFLMKTVVFFLLYFGRDDTPAVFRRTWRDLVGIVSRRRPAAVRALLLLVGPRGERPGVRVTVAAFVALHRLHLLGPFARLFCRGARSRSEQTEDRAPTT